jgi:hypothetical protein
VIGAGIGLGIGLACHHYQDLGDDKKVRLAEYVQPISLPIAAAIATKCVDSNTVANTALKSDNIDLFQYVIDNYCTQKDWEELAFNVIQLNKLDFFMRIENNTPFLPYEQLIQKSTNGVMIDYLVQSVVEPDGCASPVELARTLSQTTRYGSLSSIERLIDIYGDSLDNLQLHKEWMWVIRSAVKSDDINKFKYVVNKLNTNTGQLNYIIGRNTGQLNNIIATNCIKNAQMLSWVLSLTNRENCVDYTNLLWMAVVKNNMEAIKVLMNHYSNLVKDSDNLQSDNYLCINYTKVMSQALIYGKMEIFDYLLSLNAASKEDIKYLTRVAVLRNVKILDKLLLIQPDQDWDSLIEATLITKDVRTLDLLCKTIDPSTYQINWNELMKSRFLQYDQYGKLTQYISKKCGLSE